MSGDVLEIDSSAVFFSGTQGHPMSCSRMCQSVQQPLLQLLSSEAGKQRHQREGLGHFRITSGGIFAAETGT